MMLRVGDRASYTKTITAEDIRAYAELTGDKNPLHLDEEYAKNTRFGRVIAHGMLTASLISAVIGTRLPGPGAIYLEQRLRFTRPVYPGDTITAEVEVVEFREEKGVVRLRTDCLNQRGERVIEGEAVLLLR
ncbi:MAG: MaoC family dehydratase [Aigarchaeota archaeon]|nr:MaoC family dehydratase [Candidatus Pelearchaeum maunauluense]